MPTYRLELRRWVGDRIDRKTTDRYFPPSGSGEYPGLDEFLRRFGSWLYFNYPTLSGIRYLKRPLLEEIFDYAEVKEDGVWRRLNSMELLSRPKIGHSDSTQLPLF